MIRHSHPGPDFTSDGRRQPQRVLVVLMAVVFLVAFAIRWPSCGESFWVDELHTAWCAFADWGEVGTRAAIGNQQGGYFYLIAFWNRLVPEGAVTLYGVEALLRLTSVLLVSCAAAWMLRIVTRTSGSLIGGLAAGLALGVESNAIFFGTELRPYAAIVFLSTAVLSLATRIIDADFHHSGAIDRTGFVRRVGLHLVVLLAASVHVTSLAVLAVMVVVFVLMDWWRWRRNRSARFVVLSIHGTAGMVWGLVAVLWMQSHESLWNAREAWTSFATANSWSQIGTLWPWADDGGLACARIDALDGVCLAWTREFRIRASDCFYWFVDRHRDDRYARVFRTVICRRRCVVASSVSRRIAAVFVRCAGMDCWGHREWTIRGSWFDQAEPGCVRFYSGCLFAVVDVAATDAEPVDAR